MKILLILPAAEHLRVKSDGYVPKRKMLRFSVLSLTTIAALTSDEHSVQICDENVEAVDFGADVNIVGISFMTGIAPRAYELADHFRKRGIITVAGGYHPTFCIDEALEHFDIVVAGEAEGVWPQVLEDIKKGQFQKVYRSNLQQDLSIVPFPRRDLLSKKKHHYITTNAVQTGRGCNHSCKFCSVSAFFEHCHRSRPLQNVLKELESIPRHFMFVDDNIIADPEYAKKLFHAMMPMNKRWISQCSIEIANDLELLDLAYKAGCRGVFVGIESMSEENLGTMEKQFNDPKGYIQRIRLIHKKGIGVQAGIIVGLDNDDIRVFERMLKFLQNARIDALQLAILTPQPGTALRREFENAARIIDNDWSHYDYRHTVIQPKMMTVEQLQNGADWLYNQFYRLDRIIIRTVRAAFSVGILPAYLMWRLNLTYRYNNKREGIVGYNPAKTESAWLQKVKLGVMQRLGIVQAGY